MTGTIKRTTTNYNLRIPVFDAPAWGSDIEQNFDIIDASIFAATGFTNIKGVWSSETLYNEGDYIVDQSNNTLWRCKIKHTSALHETFAETRDSHPTYWEVVNRIVGARGEWKSGESYLVNDFIANKNRYGVITSNYISGSSYDVDVASGNVLTLIDTSKTVKDVQDLVASMSDTGQAQVTQAQGYAKAASDDASYILSQISIVKNMRDSVITAQTDVNTVQQEVKDIKQTIDAAESHIDQDRDVVEKAAAEAVSVGDSIRKAQISVSASRDETLKAQKDVLKIYGNFGGGKTGQALIKQSDDDYDYKWQVIKGGGMGNMLAATYDPQNIGKDAFDRANHTGVQNVDTITGLHKIAKTGDYNDLTNKPSQGVSTHIVDRHIKRSQDITIRILDTKIDKTGDKTLTGSFSTSGYFSAGRGLGPVALTVQDGTDGDASVAFNHTREIPEISGSSARITSPVGGATARLVFQIGSNAIASTAPKMTNIMVLDDKGMSTPGNISAFSDRRIKTDIKTLTNALSSIEKLRGCTFEKNGKDSIGVIAQEVQDVFPQVVIEQHNGMLAVDYGLLVAPLVEAVKDLAKRVQTLEMTQ